MTKLCLVRHGQTDWNMEGRYQGQSDIPLNEHGRAMAHRLAEALDGQDFSIIYSSDLLRAVETACILAKKLHLAIIADARLREINQGEWEGQLVETIKNHYSALWDLRSIEPESFRPPGGETVHEVAARVYEFLDDLTQKYQSGKILVVSHGLAIATVICRDLGIPIAQSYQYIPENVEPVWIEWTSENADAQDHRTYKK